MKISSRNLTVHLQSHVWLTLLLICFTGALSWSLVIEPASAQRYSKPAAASPGNEPKLTYPVSKKVDQVDDYFGIKVADPYRWLEDENSPDTKAWVDAQNKLTFAYLDKIPYRDQLKARLTELLNYPRYSSPFHRGETYFFSKNDGLQNQSVYYIQKGLNGTPEVFLDPNKFSTDGTSTLSAFDLSKDGRYLAYGTSQGGSDWVDIHVMEVATRKILPDELKWLKASGISWQGEGFFYSRYPVPEKGRELTSKNEFQTVYFHKVGTTQAEDQLVYEDKQNPQRFQNVGTTEDERFAILSISERGKGKKGNALFYKDLSKGDTEFSSDRR